MLRQTTYSLFSCNISKSYHKQKHVDLIDVISTSIKYPPEKFYKCIYMPLLADVLMALRYKRIETNLNSSERG